MLEIFFRIFYAFDDIRGESNTNLPFEAISTPKPANDHV